MLCKQRQNTAHTSRNTDRVWESRKKSKLWQTQTLNLHLESDKAQHLAATSGQCHHAP